jgi:hypothetical protein
VNAMRSACGQPLRPDVAHRSSRGRLVRAIVFAAAVIVVRWLSPGGSLAASAQPETAVAKRFGYFFGVNGAFTKLDLRGGGVFARWMLPRVQGLAEWVGPADGAAVGWAADSWQYDPKSREIYGVVPANGFGENESVDQRSIIRLGLPWLQPLQRYGPLPRRSHRR